MMHWNCTRAAGRKVCLNTTPIQHVKRWWQLALCAQQLHNVYHDTLLVQPIGCVMSFSSFVRRSVHTENLLPLEIRLGQTDPWLCLQLVPPPWVTDMKFNKPLGLPTVFHSSNQLAKSVSKNTKLKSDLFGQSIFSSLINWHKGTYMDMHTFLPVLGSLYFTQFSPDSFFFPHQWPALTS